MSRMEDTSGNIWFKQEKHEERLNHAVRGAHAVIPFQCEDCWMLNLEGRLPVAGLDDMYIMLIRRANLDAIAGRATTTIEAHANQIKRTVANCSLFGKKKHQSLQEVLCRLRIMLEWDWQLRWSS